MAGRLHITNEAVAYLGEVMFQYQLWIMWFLSYPVQMNSFFTINKKKHGPINRPSVSGMQSDQVENKYISMSDGKLRLAAFPFSAGAYTLRGFLKRHSQTILEAIDQREREMIEIWVVLESVKSTDPD